MYTNFLKIDVSDIDNSLYRMALFLYIVLSYLFNNSITYVPTIIGNENDSYLTIGLVIVSLMLIVKILHQLETRDILKISLLFIYGVVSWAISGSLFFFVITLFLLSAKDVEVDSVMKTVFISTLACFLLTIYLANTGVLQNYLSYKNGSYVYAYGFRNVNGFAMVVFELNLLFLYLKKNRLNYFSIFIFIGIGHLNYYLSQARTPLFTTIILSILLIPYIYTKKRGIDLVDFLGRGIIRGILIAFIISAFILIFFVDSLDNNDLIMSGRLHLTYLFIKEYGISLFGTHIETRAGRTLDVGYIYILLSYGIFGLLSFLAGYIGAIKESIFQRDTIRTLVIFAFLLYGIGETMIMRLEFNFSLLFMIPYIWNDSISEEQESSQE